MKTYKCPYCEIRKDKQELINHIEFEHEEMVPENYTPSRIVFNIVNKKTHGVCVACKKETDWNESACKYDRLHDNDKCRKKLRSIYEKNMLRVYKKTTLLDDPEYQEKKMLANRSISGSYTFVDGGKRTYTGSFEKKALEFMDTVLGIPSKDIMSPGPTLEYEHGGKKLHWITDILYIPYNLIIEVKDGGNNPNNRNMEDYREKQINKEKMITNMGTYNYLRLTNNNFEQLLEAFAELKLQTMDESDDKKTIIKINEMAPPGGVPSAGSSGYIVHYGYNNVLSGDVEGIALADDIIPNSLYIIDSETNKIKKEDISFLDNRLISIYKYMGDKKRYVNLLKEIKSNGIEYNKNFFYEALSQKELLSDDQIDYDDLFEKFDINAIIGKVSSEASTLIQEYHAINNSGPIGIPLMNKNDIVLKNRLLEKYNGLDILEDHNGYYAVNKNTNIRSTSHKNMRDIMIEGVI